jgi:acetoin:2,6-dichlorophenolindophenol oxidoreductase subunit beta
MDQVINHAAKIRFMSGGQTSCPLTIRCMAGAGAGLGGQHSDMYEAWFAHVPGIKVVMPSNPADWTGLLYSAIFDDDPVIVVEPMLLMHMKGDAAPDGHRVPLGKAAVRREGSDVSVIGYGRAFLDVLTVADKLAGEGIGVEAIDLRTIKPWDRDAVLGSVARTGRAVIVHEAVRDFGVGAEIAATLHEELWGQLKAPVRRVASKNTPVPYSPPLEQAFLWQAADIEAAIRSTLA